MKRKKPVIGILFDAGAGPYSHKIMQGVCRAAERLNAHVLFVNGGEFRSNLNYNKQDNVLYSYIGQNCFDGLLFTGTIANNVSKETFLDFLSVFKSIPMVSISEKIREDIPSIAIDNRQGLGAVIDHLIQEHGYKRIAFMGGTAFNFDSTERLKTYKNCLRKADIPFDETLVGKGDFWRDPAISEIDRIYRETGGNIDAVVCANDEMALAIMSYAKNKGIAVPRDLAVTGFDNTEESLLTYSPLTTVEQPVDKLAESALECLLDKIAGKSVPDIIRVPSTPVFRESCGCSLRIRLSCEANAEEDVQAFLTRFPSIQSKPYLRQQTEDVFGQFEKSILADSISEDFTEAVNKLISLLLATEEPIRDLDEYLQSMLKLLITKDESIRHRSQLGEIRQQIQTILEAKKRQMSSLEGYRTRIRMERIDNMIFRLMESRSLAELIDIVKESLIYIEIDTFLFFEYRDPFRYNPEMPEKVPQEAILAGGMLRNIDVELEGREYFPTMEIISRNLEVFGDWSSLVLYPVYNQDEHYGFFLLPADITMFRICFNLKFQLGSAIRRILLLEEISQLDDLKNEFIANITHDLKSPLTIILNMVELGLNYGSPISEETRKKFGIIQEAGKRLNRTIERLLDLARLEAQGIKLHITPTNIAAFLENILGFYRSSLSATGIKIKKDFSADDSFFVYSDEDKLDEIVQNVLSNAVKFIDKKTGIISVSLSEDDSFVSIRIADNGIGIPPDKLESIFGKFIQAQDSIHSQYGGSGIGLAYARQLLHYLKGEVFAESDGPGKGSCFTIKLRKGTEHFSDEDMSHIPSHGLPERTAKLPMSVLKDDDVKQERIEISEQNGRGEYDIRKAVILIVDDEEPIRDIIHQFLKKAGFRNFILAPDGQAALTLAKKHSPDIIVSDLNMPMMNGEQLYSSLEKNSSTAPTPFIFLSAVSDSTKINQLRKSGAKAYLKKPIDKDELEVTVQQLLEDFYKKRKLAEMVSVDSMTCLLNHKSIINELETETAKRKLTPLSIIFCDIDFFKDVNDAYGHQTGDTVLCETAGMMKELLRKSDSIGRYGGEEFLIILRETALKEAVKVAGKIQKGISAMLERNPSLPVFTMSFGIVSLIDHAEAIAAELGIGDILELYGQSEKTNPDWNYLNRKKNLIPRILIDMADNALYAAKASVCKNCGHTSVKKDFHNSSICPNCGIGTLATGRDRIKVYPDISPA